MKIKLGIITIVCGITIPLVALCLSSMSLGNRPAKGFLETIERMDVVLIKGTWTEDPKLPQFQRAGEATNYLLGRTPQAKESLAIDYLMGRTPKPSPRYEGRITVKFKNVLAFNILMVATGISILLLSKYSPHTR